MNLDEFLKSNLYDRMSMYARLIVDVVISDFGAKTIEDLYEMLGQEGLPTTEVLEDDLERAANEAYTTVSAYIFNSKVEARREAQNEHTS